MRSFDATVKESNQNSQFRFPTQTFCEPASPSISLVESVNQSFCFLPSEHVWVRKTPICLGTPIKFTISKPRADNWNDFPKITGPLECVQIPCQAPHSGGRWLGRRNATSKRHIQDNYVGCRGVAIGGAAGAAAPGPVAGPKTYTHHSSRTPPFEHRRSTGPISFWRHTLSPICLSSTTHFR